MYTNPSSHERLTDGDTDGWLCNISIHPQLYKPNMQKKYYTIPVIAAVILSLGFSSINFNAQADSVDQSQTSGSTNAGFGESSGLKYTCQGFKPTYDQVTAISFKINSVGSKGMLLWIDSGTSNSFPTGILESGLGSMEILNSQLVSNVLTKYTFPTPISVTPNSQYVFCLAPWNTTTHTYSSDYRDLKTSLSNPYANGKSAVYNGTSWSNHDSGNADRVFETYGQNAGTPTPTPSPTPTPEPTPTPSPTVPGHVVIVVDENRNYSETLVDMPWYNLVASNGGDALQFYANAHPSYPNYNALTAGETIIHSNAFSQGPLYVTNLFDELTKASKSWKVYAEGLPSVGYTGGTTGKYMKHHNPAVYFASVVNVTSERNKVVPFTQFATDLANDTLPQFSFIIPDNDSNSHDTTVAYADDWLETNIGPLLTDNQFTQDGLLILTWDEAQDEDVTLGGGRIRTVFYGPATAKRGFTSSTTYQLPSILKTVVDIFDLAKHPGDSKYAPGMDEFLLEEIN